MKRVASFLFFSGVAVALIAAFSASASTAQDAQGFATNWCESPVTIPLAQANASSTGLAPNVSTARGAAADLSTDGPVVRMTEPGSRVQIELEQTLFHTQWKFAGVDSEDAVRVDATLGRARQPIDAASVRGALAVDSSSDARGLVARGWETPGSVGEIDVFHPTTQILLTNEGQTPIDLVAAVGCPALRLDSTTVSTPTWDADAQRFIAEHEIELQNLLANWKAEAIRSLYAEASSTIIDDLTIDIAVSADGFAGAEIIELDMSDSLRQRWNQAFDGVSDTGLLSIPLELSNGEPLKVRLTLAYQPDFDDSSWSEGVEAPAPFVQVRGEVDDTQVGMSAVLRRDGLDVDAAVEPNRLISPAPGVVVDHEHTQPPTSRPDGSIVLDERIVITNVGDTVINDLQVSYSQASMYGSRTALVDFRGTASGDCAGLLSPDFDGGASPIVLSSPDGLGIDGVCTLDLASTVLPGEIPSASGTDYETAVVATARSGVRAVRDAAAVRVTLAQNPALAVQMSDPVITNLRDGQYRISGSLTVDNTGDLDVEAVGARLAFDALDGVELAGIDASVERLDMGATGSADSCGLRAAPTRRVDGFQVSGNGALAAGDSCTFDFSLLTRPGARLDDWVIEAAASGTSVRGVDLVPSSTSERFSLPEAPAIDVDVSTTDISNNGDGTYTVVFATTVSNAGDVPLVEVNAPPAEAEIFGETLVRSDVTVDTCRGVSWRNPLEVSVPAATCEISRTSIIEPGAALDDWTMAVAVAARSTSSAEVSTSAEAPPVDFVERPSLDTTVTVESLEKLDEERFRIVLSGTMINTGDVELRELSATLDLEQSFGDIEYTVGRLSATGAFSERTFDGSLERRLLREGNTLAAGETAQWRLVVTAASFAAPGPFGFVVEGSAVSPAGTRVLPDPVSISRPLPLVRVIERSVETENNGDGTYDVQHQVSVRNAGSAALSTIAVSTDFTEVFGGSLVAEPTVETTCAMSVAPGETCVHTQLATVRPGSALGPYTVSVSVAGTDAESVEAIVVPGPASSIDEGASFAPVQFVEHPAVEIEGLAQPLTNNGDGTYSTSHRFVVTNTGDVPLYRVDAVDPVDETFGAAVVSNEPTVDTCADVSSAEPLSVGDQCERWHDAVIRPGSNLGPWVIEGQVTARTPSFATVDALIALPRLIFEEHVALEATSSLSALENNGDGTYVVAHDVRVENTGDVPLRSIDVTDGGVGLGERRVTREVLLDECGQVSASFVLPPGEVCQLTAHHTVRPGADLGPIELQTEVAGTSLSAAVESTSTTNDPMTLTEAPEILLSSAVVSLESTSDEQMRIVVEFVADNTGDVDVAELQLDLALQELFPDMNPRVDALISDDFDVNGAFGADDTTALLDEGQLLRSQDAGAVTLIVTIDPGDRVGPFIADLDLTGRSPAERPVAASLAAQVDLPSIHLAFVAQTIDNNGDGSYLLTTTYEITNDGSTPLGSVGFVEDRQTQFEGVSAELVAVRSNTLTINEPSDAAGDADLLAAGVELAVGERGLLTTSVLVEPGNVLGPFVPEAIARALSPTGTEVVAELATSNVVVFDEQPALRIEQELRNRPVWDGSGSFAVDFVIEVVNDGDVEVRNLQVHQDLLRALGAGSTLAVRDIRSETLTVNDDFDGRGEVLSDTGETISDAGDTRLLSGFDTLAPGDRAIIELDMTIAPENRGVYSTRTVVSALTPAGADIGTEGAEIEANTLTRLSVEGELGVAKRVIGEPALLADGSIAVTYEIRVENAGPFPLTDVQVHDQLGQAFGVSSTFGTSPVRVAPESPCAGHVSPSYDGGAVDPVLVSGVSLQPGEKCQLQYDAVVNPSKPLPGPFRSSAIAIGSDPFSDIVIDDSTDGIDIDPDGNAEPGDNDVATSVIVGLPEPAVAVEVEVVDTSLSAQVGWFDMTVRAVLTNTGPLDIESTRLTTNLREAFDGPFEIIEVSSQDVVANPVFDGDEQSNVLRARNQIRSGESAQVLIRLRARPASADQLLVNVSLDARSITGVEVTAAPAEDLRIDVPQGLGLENGNLLASLSDEEERLLALGGLAFLLFFLILVHRVVRRLRARKARRAARHGKGGRPPRSAVRREQVIDLRDRQSIPGTPPASGSPGRRDHAPHRRRGRSVKH